MILPLGALDLAGAVGADGEGPAQFVRDDVVVPIVLEDGVAAVGAVGDVVGFAGRGGLVSMPSTASCLAFRRAAPARLAGGRAAFAGRPAAPA
jgi:hypothetical protein